MKYEETARLGVKICMNAIKNPLTGLLESGNLGTSEESLEIKNEDFKRFNGDYMYGMVNSFLSAFYELSHMEKIEVYAQFYKKYLSAKSYRANHYGNHRLVLKNGDIYLENANTAKCVLRGR